jgi:hypothetical protein
VWGGEKCIQILVGKLEEKKQFRRHGSRWKDNRVLKLNHSFSSGYEQFAGSFEYSRGFSSFMKGGKFLE